MSEFENLHKLLLLYRGELSRRRVSWRLCLVEVMSTIFSWNRAEYHITSCLKLTCSLNRK